MTPPGLVNFSLRPFVSHLSRLRDGSPSSIRFLRVRSPLYLQGMGENRLLGFRDKSPAILQFFIKPPIVLTNLTQTWSGYRCYPVRRTDYGTAVTMSKEGELDDRPWTRLYRVFRESVTNRIEFRGSVPSTVSPRGDARRGSRSNTLLHTSLTHSRDNRDCKMLRS